MSCPDCQSIANAQLSLKAEIVTLNLERIQLQREISILEQDLAHAKNTHCLPIDLFAAHTLAAMSQQSYKQVIVNAHPTITGDTVEQVICEAAWSHAKKMMELRPNYI